MEVVKRISDGVIFPWSPVIAANPGFVVTTLEAERAVKEKSEKAAKKAEKATVDPLVEKPV